MPKYVYQSLESGNYYEFEQSFHDEAYSFHPETGEAIKRVIFAPAVIFKGSGWYAKDSKSGAKPGVKSETKSEAKPEAKPEAAKSETKSEVTKSESSNTAAD